MYYDELIDICHFRHINKEGENKKMKKPLIKKIIIALILVILLIAAIFFIWTQNTYKAISEPAIDMDSNYMEEDNWIIYGNKESSNGLILYPGAKVEPDAYAYLAQELSKNNILVAIPNVRLNLALFDYSKADEIIEKYSDVTWIVGGHSMGGAAAAMYADANMDRVKGLILLGAYSAENDNLSKSDLPVLSISGSNDGLSTPEKIEEKKSNLPNTAEFYEITGGNHAQFGVYGEQSGDNEAEIKVKEQQDKIVKAIKEWINNEID